MLLRVRRLSNLPCSMMLVHVSQHWHKCTLAVTMAFCVGHWHTANPPAQVPLRLGRRRVNVKESSLTPGYGVLESCAQFA